MKHSYVVLADREGRKAKNKQEGKIRGDLSLQARCTGSQDAEAHSKPVASRISGAPAFPEAACYTSNSSLSRR